MPTTLQPHSAPRSSMGQHRAAHLLVVLSLLLGLTLGLTLGLLPAVALAAPPHLAPMQAESETVPLIYVSELLPAADGVGRLITLTLAADGSATWSTNFLNGEAPLVEVGAWGFDDAEGALQLTLTGTEDEVYAAPVEFIFAEEADGSLTAVAWDETRYGSEALVLAPAEDVALAGLYASETLPAADSPGRAITLDLGVDGRAILTTDFLNGEDPLIELGQWGAGEDGAQIFASFSGRPNAVYEAPIDWTFAVDGDTLTATEWDETLYGSQALVLTRVAAVAPAPPDGVWISQILPAASSPGQVVMLVLYPDGDLQSSTWYLNKELPIIEEGTWVDSGDGTVLVTVTGSSEREYETPQELTFDYVGDTLTYLSLSLARLEPVAAADAPQPTAFYTSQVEPAASSPGLQRSLIVYEDNSVQMVSDFLNGEEPLVEVGQWSANEDGSITVTLTGTEQEAYAEAVVITFALDEGTLTATEWDTALYGSAGLTFAEQDLEELLLEDAEPLSGAPDLEPVAVLTTTTGSDVAAGTAVTAALPPTSTLPATNTNPATDTADVATDAADAATTPDGDLAALAQPFESPAGAQAVYVSDVLPAASSPGRLIRLVLFEDGTCQLITDFLNGEPPVLEIGTWAESAAAEIDVSITGQIASTYAEPIVTTFARVDETLVAVQWDEAIYGSEPLTLTLESGG